MPLSHVDRDPIVLAARAARAISTASQMAYAQLAPDLTIVQHSTNFPRLLEGSAPEVVGTAVTDLLWELVGSEALLAEIVNGRRPTYRLEYVNRELPDGTTAYLNFLILPLETAQPELGLLLLIEDATTIGHLQQSLVQDRNELRLTQQQLTAANEELNQLNRLKSLFLSMSAHDLRTPLTAIAGYASLMQDRLPLDTDGNILDYLTIIIHQTRRLNGLISDFLDLDQIEQGQLTLEPTPFDLRDLLAEIAAFMQINASNRQITLQTQLPDTPILLWADYEKLYRVVYNLVGNAVKYTRREGQVIIQAWQQQNQIVMKVIDNGHGLTQEQIDNLFQLYYRTEEARKSRTAGTGLGLYIVKMLVEAHQGHISVTSEPDKGSTFTVFLPSKTPVRE